MPLRECMEKHTHREYATWMMWLEDEWNVPDRTDAYLMQIACEIVRKDTGDKSLKPGQFKLSFPTRKPEPKPLQKETVEEYSKRARRIWEQRLGM